MFSSKSKAYQNQCQWRSCIIATQTPDRSWSVSYSSLVFYPYLKPEDNKYGADVYNSWKGFKYPYVKIDCKNPGFDINPLLNHIKLLSGKGDEAIRTQKYVLNWIAHMIQRPFEKPNTALCFKSEQGTGKSMFWSFIGRMMGENLSISTGNINNITGDFNGMIEGRLLIIAEEAVDYVKKSGSHILKDLITSDRQVINRKGVNQYEVKHFGRCVFLSNSDLPVRPEAGCRRFAVAECDDSLVMDTQYFTIFKKYLDENVQNIFNWFANYPMDIVVTDRKELPHTAAKETLIMKSITPPIKAVMDLYKHLDTPEQVQRFTK